MRTLYHFSICPFCRKIRLLLKEKKLEFDSVITRRWESEEAILSINPTKDVPVLVEDTNQTIVDTYAITEYIEETYPDYPLLGRSSLMRAEVRRLISWFDVKFNHEVTKKLVFEKVLKHHYKKEPPNSEAMRQGRVYIQEHLRYIGWLSDRRKWLAGEEFSLADITAAAHLSSIDYLGDVPWDKFREAKHWYARVKSRPSFRTILTDLVPGHIPPSYYANLDF